MSFLVHPCISVRLLLTVKDEVQQHSILQAVESGNRLLKWKWKKVPKCGGTFEKYRRNQERNRNIPGKLWWLALDYTSSRVISVNWFIIIRINLILVFKAICRMLFFLDVPANVGSWPCIHPKKSLISWHFLHLREFNLNSRDIEGNSVVWIQASCKTFSDKLVMLDYLDKHYST